MNQRSRTIVTTDGEIDDINSFIRFLLYTNDVDVAGIILTSSMFHYTGTAEKPALRWTGTTWVTEMIDRYAQVYPNLKKHDNNYPTPEYLHSIYKLGNITDVGEMDIETEGSNLIVNVLLDDDPRLVLIQTWGGTNTTARALKTIQERYESTEEWVKIKQKVENKMVLYIILDQDSTYKDYIAPNWNLNIISDQANFGFFAYMWKGLPDRIRRTLEPQWFLDNLMNKGALLDKYALIGDGHYLEGEDDNFQFGNQAYLDKHPEAQRYEFISEGDSPSYFYLLGQGLRGAERPDYGGWGGRFGLVENKTYGNSVVDYNPISQRFEMEYGLTRWIEDIQVDFAARANWCVMDDFNAVNHYPQIAEVETDQVVSAGQIVTLSAPALDPNGLELDYNWYCYFEVSSYWDFSQVELETVWAHLGEMKIPLTKHSAQMPLDAKLDMTGTDTETVTITIPEDAKAGNTFHIILEVRNKALTPLKSYKRFILTVK